MSGEPTILFGVGATKAGTSWLYEYLRGHPDCRLSTIKELHYFDAVTDEDVVRQIRRTKREMAALREKLAAASGRQVENLRTRIKEMGEWVEVLASSPPGGSNQGYLGFLKRGRVAERIVGDITPSYGLLSVDRLQVMARLGEDVRFVYQMRDPVSRLWSHVRMNAKRECKTGDVEAFAYDMLDGILAGQMDDNARGILVRGDYAGAVDRLRHGVAADKLFIGFMEEVISTEGTARLCLFLGIAAQPGDVDKHVHAGLPIPLDEKRRQRARDMLRPQYAFAAAEFGALPEAWRQNMTGMAA